MQTFQYTQQLLYSYAGVYSSLINCLKEKCATVHDSLFFPLLLLVSLPETVAIRKEITQTMQNFANNCKLTLEELYSYEIGNILERFKSTYKSWKKNSPDRFAFDIYVKLAGPSLEKHWTEVLLIISQCCESEKDIEIRMDMIILLDKIITQQALFEQIKNYIEFILPEILFPSMSWRAGRPNYKVRKAAVVDMIHIFQNNLISPETTIKFFQDFLSNLKTNLGDDWDAELRYLSIQLAKLFLQNTSEILTYDHISELYNILLSRLDDSQDTNRILTCEVLILFMNIGKRLNLSTSIYDHIIENSLIHLDDPNEKVRNAVEKYLMVALTLHPKNFLKFIESSENKFTHKSYLVSLKEEAQKLV
jgi:dynein assembly factor 5